MTVIHRIASGTKSQRHAAVATPRPAGDKWRPTAARFPEDGPAASGPGPGEEAGIPAGRVTANSGSVVIVPAVRAGNRPGSSRATAGGPVTATGPSARTETTPTGWANVPHVRPTRFRNPAAAAGKRRSEGIGHDP